MTFLTNVATRLSYYSVSDDEFISHLPYGISVGGKLLCCNVLDDDNDDYLKVYVSLYYLSLRGHNDPLSH